MRFQTLTALSAFAALTAAADVELEWMHDKTTGKTTLGVFDIEDGELLAKSCGSVLKAAKTIDFSKTDENGNGSFTVGDKSYTVHELSDISGGIFCSKKWHDSVAIVECEGFQWEATDVDAIDNDCPDLEYHPMRKRVRGRANIVKQQDFHANSTELESRHVPWTPRQCGFNNAVVNLVGDGDPHQNYYNQQPSETNTCSQSAGCSVGQSQSFTISIDFSIGGAGSKSYGWINGGFGVSESWGTTNIWTCNGNPGDTICIWHNTAHTAYTVLGTQFVCNDPQPSVQYVMFSPNNNNAGGGFYCVTGTCRSANSAYWDYSGRAGGP